jgi:hypothetical protein
MTDFLVPPNVNVAMDANERMVLLNKETGRWYALNTTGTTVFEKLRNGSSIDETIAALVAMYPDIPGKRLSEDAHDILFALVKRGLLVPDVPRARLSAAIDMALPTTSTSRIRFLDRMTVLAAFPSTLLLLRLPFRISLAFIGWLKGNWVVQEADRDDTIATLTAVGVLAKHHPGRLACLERSLTCVLALAFRRHGADWCFGVSTDPRSFHAWVEIAGTPVLLPQDEPVTSVYRPVFRV